MWSRRVATPPLRGQPLQNGIAVSRQTFVNQSFRGHGEEGQAELGALTGGEAVAVAEVGADGEKGGLLLGKAP